MVGHKIPIKKQSGAASKKRQRAAAKNGARIRQGGVLEIVLETFRHHRSEAIIASGISRKFPKS